MSAVEYQALADDAAVETQRVRGMAAQILREAVTAADAAYTAAVQAAAGTGDWGPVQMAASIAKKARLSLAAGAIPDATL